MNKISIQYHQTAIGDLILGSFQNSLCLLDFGHRENRSLIDNRLQNTLNAKFHQKDNRLLKETKEQIDQYLDGLRKKFDIPFLTIGTDFQKQVWKALLDVEYGTTTSYLHMAKTINREKAVRAVANANGANAIALIVPCHRIIGSNGKLVGYAGGLRAKQKLLEIERTH